MGGGAEGGQELGLAGRGAREVLLLHMAVAPDLQREPCDLKRKGVVLGLSGGIDSSAVAALAVRALGKDRVLGLFMPEYDSAGDSLRLGRLVACPADAKLLLRIKDTPHQLALPIEEFKWTW